MLNTTLCYIEREDCYLMLYRNKKKNDLNAGKWVGVGGKFEPGENAEQCLIREVREETGLELDSYIFKGIIRFRNDSWEDEDMYLYTAVPTEESVRLCEAPGGSFSSCNEGELKWISKNEVLGLRMWSGDRYFLEKLLEGAEQVNLKLIYKGDELVRVEYE